MDRVDTLQDNIAWYRQFWPWFIMSIPAATVLACVYTIFLAVTTSDSLVVRGRDGVDVVTGRMLAAEQAAALQDLHGRLSLDPGSGQLIVEIDNLPASQRGETLSLEFSHPAFAGRDHRVELVPAPHASTARFVGRQQAALDERWYLVLTHADWRLTGVWEGRDSATLTARGAH